MNKLYAFYEVLDLPTEASREEVKQAFHDLLLVWHPDKHAGNERLRAKAELKTQEIICAYETIVQHLSTRARGTIPQRPSAEDPPPLKPRYQNSFAANQNGNRRFHPAPRSRLEALLGGQAFHALGWLGDILLAPMRSLFSIRK